MKKSEIRKLIIMEVNAMGEGDFHHLCVEFLSEKYNQRFINTGINRKNRPIGHDLDAISPDNKIAGEFSVDQDYFSGKFPKLRGDLNHSLQRIPKPREIKLISSQPVSNLNRKLLSVYFKYVTYKKKIKVELYDSNRLVDEVLTLALNSQTFFNTISQQVTLFRKLMVLYGSENLFPPVSPEYKARPIEEKSITQSIISYPITLIHGVSGVGKSQIAIKVKQSLPLKFDFVFWVSGEELKDINSLKAYELKMYGNTYDLVNLMKDSDVLVCIDSLEDKDFILEQLPQIKLSKGSRIVVTSQKLTKLKGIAVHHLEGMRNLEFRSVIKEGNQLADNLADRVFNFCGGHPLVASIIAKMLVAGDLLPSDIEDSLTTLGGLDVGKNQNLLQRLISNHLESIKPGIEYIKALNTDRLHKALTERVLTKIETTKLISRGFLLEQESGYFKVHDLLLNTIRESQISLNTDQWKKKVLEIFRDRDRNLTELEFFQISNNHFELVKAIAWETRDVTALYLVASYTEVDKTFNAKEFQEKYLPLISSLNFSTAGYYDVMLAIEFYEVMYRHYQYYERKYAEAQEMIKNGLEVCDNYLSHGTDRSFEKNVYHHSGKFHRLLKKYDEALEAYDKAIEIDPDFLEPRIQIFRIYHWINTDRDSTEELKRKHGKKADPELIKKILDRAKNSYETVSPSLLLHSFDELRKSPFYDVIDQYVIDYEEIFYQTIKIAQFRDKHSYIKILAGVGDRFIRNNPSKFEKELDTLVLPSPLSVDTEIAFELGQIYKSLAKAKKDKALLLLAGAYYEKAIQHEKISDFDLSHIVDGYNLLAEYQKANKLYEKIHKKDAPFIYLRRSWTLYMLNRRQEALEHIEKGITALPKYLHGLHMKTFEEMKNKIETQQKLEDINSWQ